MSRENKKYTLADLAEITHTRLVGNANHCISSVDDLESATSEDASFLANPRYTQAMKQSHAGVICISTSTPLLEGKNFLVSDDPSRTFQQIFEMVIDLGNQKSGFKGIHHTAVIHPTAKLAQNVQVGPYVVIDQGCTIGEGTILYPFVSIGSGVSIGSNCLLHAHSVVRERCILENRVILQPGAIIGSCGFGFTTDSKGKHTKLDQLGIVVIEDDVEIGANTTIDRARFKETRISRGTKIDNLVQIGHNVIIGQDNIIVSQSGIAGSVKTGKNVVLGGQAGVVGHLEIADGVMIATRGGVSKSLPRAGKYAGSPVMALAEHNRQQVHLRKISEYVKQIEKLEERINKLEQSQK